MTTQPESCELSKDAFLTPPREAIDVAITMAEEHLNEIKRHRQEVIKNDDGNRDHPAYVYSHITLHSRGFLWELVAAFDLALCWANTRFHLGIADHRVTWKNVKSECSSSQDAACAAAFAELSATHSSDWFSSVTRYRNYAHRNFIVFKGIWRQDSDPQVFWPHAVDGASHYEDLSVALAGYLAQFKDFLARLEPLMK